MSETIAIALRDKLTLEHLDLDLFRAQNEATLGERLFGGQVLAQALSAAQLTIDDRSCHSLHGYFLRPESSTSRLFFRSNGSEMVKVLAPGALWVFKMVRQFSVWMPHFKLKNLA